MCIYCIEICILFTQISILLPHSSFSCALFCGHKLVVVMDDTIKTVFCMDKILSCAHKIFIHGHKSFNLREQLITFVKSGADTFQNDVQNYVYLQTQPFFPRECMSNAVEPGHPTWQLCRQMTVAAFLIVTRLSVSAEALV